MHWRDEGSQLQTCAFISLDGFVVPGRFLYGSGSTARDGLRTGPATERPFIFAKDPGSCGSYSGILHGFMFPSSTGPQRKGHRDAGTIVLKIKRVCLDGQKAANALQKPPDASDSPARVSDHRIGYGDERPTYEQSPSTWKLKPVGGSKRRSFVTFVFRYRPRGESDLGGSVVLIPCRVSALARHHTGGRWSYGGRTWERFLAAAQGSERTGGRRTPHYAEPLAESQPEARRANGGCLIPGLAGRCR